MRAQSIIAALAFLSIGAGSSEAQERHGRYTLSPAENGFVRLDTVTGAMSLCSRKEQGWTCEPMDDRAKALQEQVEQLMAENRALRAEIDRLEKAQPGDRDSSGQAFRQERPGGRSFDLPSEQDVDRALDYVERIYKKFRDRLRQLEQEEHQRKGTAL
jgi:regulator of replication initiation timing